MNRRLVKILAIIAAVGGLMGVVGATAWADTFTPAIEEPTANLGGFGAPVLGGGTPGRSENGSTSGHSKDGRDYGYSSGDNLGSPGSDYTSGGRDSAGSSYPDSGGGGN